MDSVTGPNHFPKGDKDADVPRSQPSWYEHVLASGERQRPVPITVKPRT